MQRDLFLTLLFFLFVFLLPAQGIEFFQGTWKEALEKAKTEDKILFVDAFAKWCGPCKAMAKNVFTQQKVGDFFNANFINLKLDMEEADGVTFGHKYPVKGYPTLLFLDGEGKVVKTVMGGQQPDGLISLGEEALKKNDKSGKYEEKYLAGDRSYELMYNYVKALNAAGKPSLKISNEYLSSAPAISENDRLLFLLEAAVNADSKLFDQVVAQKAKLISLAGKASYEEKCMAACQKGIDHAVEFEMESMLEEVCKKAEVTFPDKADQFTASARMKFYKSIKDEGKYIAAYRALAKNAAGDQEKLKFIIIDISASFKDNPKMISDATGYAEKIYESKSDIESLNMYCSLLVLNKSVEKALKLAKEAKAKAEKEGQDLSPYDGLINYLMSKKA